jgi:hypothetical protein
MVSIAVRPGCLALPGIFVPASFLPREDILSVRLCAESYQATQRLQRSIRLLKCSVALLFIAGAIAALLRLVLAVDPLYLWVLAALPVASVSILAKLLDDARGVRLLTASPFHITGQSRSEQWASALEQLNLRDGGIENA